MDIYVFVVVVVDVVVIIVVIVNQAINSFTCLLVYLSTEQKKRSPDISVGGPQEKKGGFLLSRIALQYHRRKWA